MADETPQFDMKLFDESPFIDKELDEVFATPRLESANEPEEDDHISNAQPLVHKMAPNKKGKASNKGSAQTKASKTKLTKTEGTRFLDANQKDVDAMMTAALNPRTLASNKWAYNAFKSWISQKNQGSTHTPIPLPEDMTDDEVLTHVPMFITSARKEDGSEYNRGSILQLVNRLQMYYRQMKRDFDFTSTRCTNGIRGVVDAKMKQLAREGHGVTVDSSNAFTQEQIRDMWDKEILGDKNAEILLQSVFFYNGIFFGLRGGDEHRSLDLDQFTIKETETQLILTYMPKVSKTFHGGVSQKRLNLQPREHVTEKGLSRCVISLYRTYFSALKNAKSGPFYRKASDKYVEGQIKFDVDRKMGKNTLSDMIKKIVREAGIEGRFTNHSGRSTCISLLAQQGISNELISSRSGHRSDSGVNGYKRIFENQKVAISNALNPPQPKKPKQCGDNLGSDSPGPSTSNAVVGRPVTPDMSLMGIHSVRTNNTLVAQTGPATFAGVFAGAAPEALTGVTIQFINNYNG